jgi:thymidylate kinase
MQASPTGSAAKSSTCVVELAGPPGSGKSTLAPTLLRNLATLENEFIFCRGNGRASLRGSQINGWQAGLRDLRAVEQIVRTQNVTRPHVEFGRRVVLLRELRKAGGSVLMEEGVVQQVANLAAANIRTNVRPADMPDIVITFARTSDECARLRRGYQNKTLLDLTNMFQRHKQAVEVIAKLYSIATVQAPQNFSERDVQVIAKAILKIRDGSRLE